MSFIAAIRGVSGPHGIYLTGKPQQLVVFTDGFVIVEASAWLILLGGAVAGTMLERTIAKQTAAAKNLDARSFQGKYPKGRLLPAADVTSLTVTKHFPGRRLELHVGGKTMRHNYALLPGAMDDVIKPAFAEIYGDRLVWNVTD